MMSPSWGHAHQAGPLDPRRRRRPPGPTVAPSGRATPRALRPGPGSTPPGPRRRPPGRTRRQRAWSQSTLGRTTKPVAITAAPGCPAGVAYVCELLGVGFVVLDVGGLG